ncbi:Asp23/Gls24 family envelope stress response protein [Galactobacter caseinivorans]|uniref:Alkaline shock response membrane anchor protein AmaP n=1 Tax=Galactobacter caseinivorans TaxID=2676123 RepID=A0A496PHF7_9MICC|nr:hypothetical protein [Galactobacter caseinivorans]RKW69921.1 hypothetical protein DWQ67_10655 [Galactobacter caseinivorans]
MIATHGVRQRVLLVVTAVLLLVVAAALALLSLGQARPLWSQAPAAGDLVLVDSPWVNGWSIALAVAGGLGVVLGLWWLLSLLPRRAKPVEYRFADGSSVSRMDSGVLAQELERSAQDQAGIESARVRLTGSRDKPGMVARFTVRPEEDFEAVRESLVTEVIRPAEAMLGAPLTQVNVEYVGTRPDKVKPNADLELSPERA